MMTHVDRAMRQPLAAAIKDALRVHDGRPGARRLAMDVHTLNIPTELREGGEAMNDRRVPPNDERAERAVLGAVLLDGRAVLESLTLTVPDFYSDMHRTIYGAFVALEAGDVAIDAVTVPAELERSGELIRGAVADFLRKNTGRAKR